MRRDAQGHRSGYEEGIAGKVHWSSPWNQDPAAVTMSFDSSTGIR